MRYLDLIRQKRGDPPDSEPPPTAAESTIRKSLRYEEIRIDELIPDEGQNTPLELPAEDDRENEEARINESTLAWFAQYERRRAEREELLALGRALGYPELPIRPGETLIPGEPAWRRFAEAAPLDCLPEALGAARLLADQRRERLAIEVALADELADQETFERLLDEYEELVELRPEMPA